MKKLIFSLTLFSLFFFFSFNLISGTETFGYNYLEQGKNLNPIINISTAWVNASDFWDNLGSPLDLLLSRFSATWIDTTLDMNGKNINGSGNISLKFGDLISEQNPDGADAIRIKGTDYVDVVIGGMTGLFTVWNVADTTPVFYVDERGDTDITGDATIGGDILLGDGDLTTTGNITSGDTLFANFLGSIVNRITKLWVVDIDSNGINLSNVNNIFLNLSGTNANQNININPFNFTANYSFFDFVGIGVAQPSHNLDVIGDVLITHTATGTNEHGLELKIDANGMGDVKGIDLIYTTGAIDTGDDEGAILINIDEFEATGGDVFGVEVLSTEGSANIWGYKVGAVVGAIHQDSGIFEDMDSASNNGVDNLAEFISTLSNVDIFVNDNDYVIIGDVNKFEEIEFILDTEASVNIKPTFHYSTGATTWGEFSPVDGTNGFENTGIIAWEDADIPTWATSGGEYLIRINRTKNNIQVAPKENKVQIAAVIEYYWDKNGDLLIRNINATNFSGSGANLHSVNITGREIDPIHNLTLDDGLVFWMRMDDVNSSGDPTDFLNKNNGTAIDNAIQDNGVLGKSFTLDGADDYINLSGFTETDGLQDITATLWFKMDDTVFDTLHRPLLAIGESGDRIPWIWGVKDTSIIAAQMGSTSPQVRTGALVKDRWYHLGFITNSTNSSMYLDGVLVDMNISIDTTGESSNGNSAIGTFPGIAHYMKGDVDDVRIYNRTLTPAEIQEIYELGDLDTTTKFTFAYFKEYIASRSGFFNFASVLLDLYVGRNLTVGANVDVGGTLGVTGNTALGGELSVSNDVTLDKDVFITGGTLDVDGDVDLTGKLSSDGGNDPPYVLYNIETRTSIIERVRQEVPESKAGGMALFYNSDLNRYESFKALTCEFFVEATNNKTFESYLKLVYKYDDGQPCYNPDSRMKYYWDKIKGEVKQKFSTVYGIKIPEDKILNKSTGELEDKPIIDDVMGIDI